MSFELPIFPLSVVLFPGMPLPLHIFEPRYRLMMSRALEADRTFGVALLAEGQEGQPNTLPTGVGTLADILEVAPFADGRMNLQTVGTRRFRILELREEDDYLIGTCEWLDDEPDDAEDAAHSTRRALSRYFDALARNTELPEGWAEVAVPADPFGLSMFIAAILTLPNIPKQEMLEMTSTRERLHLEEFLLERARLVQLAFARHAQSGWAQAPTDPSMGQFAGFVSLN